MKPRRRFIAEFKANVALEAIRSEQTISELATKHQLPLNQNAQWKRQRVAPRQRPAAVGAEGKPHEYEPDLLRQRSLVARYEKACRGELVVAAPVGFVKVGDRIEKDPDRCVQEAIIMVFDKVAELGSARQALRRRSTGRVRWAGQASWPLTCASCGSA